MNHSYCCCCCSGYIAAAAVVVAVVVVAAVVAAVFIQLLICRLEEGDSSFDWSMMMTRDEAGEVRAKVRFIEWIEIDI